VRKFAGKMPDANPAANILCEPAQSKCTWTCHKRHLVRKFTGNMPYAAYPATRVLREPAQSIRSIFSEIYTENAGGFRYHLD